MNSAAETVFGLSAIVAAISAAQLASSASKIANELKRLRTSLTDEDDYPALKKIANMLVDIRNRTSTEEPFAFGVPKADTKENEPVS